MNDNQYAELRKGKVKWYYVVKNAGNHEVMSQSEHYSSKSNARRAAKRAGYVVHE